MKEEGIRRKDRYIYGTVSGFQTLQTGAQVSTEARCKAKSN